MTHSLQAGRFGSFPLPQRKTPVAIATCTEWKMVQKFQRKSFWVCFDGTVRIVPFSKRRRCGSRRGRQGARWAALSGQKVPLRGSLASGSEVPPGREPLPADDPSPGARPCFLQAPTCLLEPREPRLHEALPQAGADARFTRGLLRVLSEKSRSEFTFKTKKEN